MKEQNEIISIRLLDREFHIKCPPEKTHDLQEAASYLDAKMRESCEVGKIVNLERIFMIASLNIANELINIKRQKNLYIDAMNNRILELQNKINEVLAD